MKKFSLVLFFILLLPQIVCAHSAWMEAIPEEGEILTAPPQHVSFKMIGFLNSERSIIEVFDQEGNKVSRKTQFMRSGDFSIMQAELLHGLKAGEYTVKWFFSNEDGHKQKGQTGSYTFVIK